MRAKNIIEENIVTVKVTPDNKFILVLTDKGTIVLLDQLTRQKLEAFEDYRSKLFYSFDCFTLIFC